VDYFEFLDQDTLYIEMKFKDLMENMQINKQFKSFAETQCKFQLSDQPSSSEKIIWLQHPYTQTIYTLLTWTEHTRTTGKRFLEIYNVCTAFSHRQKGYSQRLIQKVIQRYYPTWNIWLGVLLQNTPAFLLYTKLGFTQPRITNTTAAGTVHPQLFIAMIYKSHSTPQRIQQTRNMIECMHEFYTFYSQPLSFKRIRMDVNSLQQIHRKLFEKREWAYAWNLFGNNLTMNPFSGISAKEDFDPLRQNLAQAFTVPLIQADFSCHTHPLSAYLAYEAIYGSPSSTDYIGVCENINIRTHFVFTIEGMYQIETSILTKLFIYYLKEYSLQNCWNTFSDLLQIYLSINKVRNIRFVLGEEYSFDVVKVEQEYQKILLEYNTFQPQDHLKLLAPVITQIRHKQIDRMIQYVHSINLFKLLTFNIEAIHDITPTQLQTLQTKRAELKNCIKQFTDKLDFQIFNIQFHPWMDIEHQLNQNHMYELSISDYSVQPPYFGNILKQKP
jgi:GNAT superfamily N-acetyltransferase